jgi:hypothetical protein
VVEQSIRVAWTSNSTGGGGGPLLFLDDGDRGLRCCDDSLLLIDVVDRLFPLCLSREIGDVARSSEEGRGEERLLWVWRSVEGRISFFCLEAGRISSRSMGTPRETRKRRRMRERSQSGGWRGGGATSWDQRERLFFVDERVSF